VPVAGVPMIGVPPGFDVDMVKFTGRACRRPTTAVSRWR
jgi:hypothetical protein